jgi:hypothetical protein
MDLQRVSYTYVQYVHIYNVQQCINIYILLLIYIYIYIYIYKIIIKIVFFPAVAYAYGLCLWSMPVACPLSMPPWYLPLIHTPMAYAPDRFFLYTKNDMLLFGSGSIHFYLDPIFLFLIQKSLCLILLHNSGAISGPQSIFNLQHITRTLLGVWYYKLLPTISTYVPQHPTTDNFLPSRIYLQINLSQNTFSKTRILW